MTKQEYEHNATFDKLIAIMEQLQLIVEEISDEQFNTDGIDPQFVGTEEFKVRAAQLHSFDAGHLAGAITIIRSDINPEYPGLAEYWERECGRRLLMALDVKP